jgi:hypothetical protein
VQSSGARQSKMVENRGSSLHFGLGFFDGGEFRISRLCLRGLNEDHCAIRTIPPLRKCPLHRANFAGPTGHVRRGGGDSSDDLLLF